MDIKTNGSPKISAIKKSSAKCRAMIPNKSRQEMIAEAAYFLAEKRGFAPGDEHRDWIEAERMVRKLFPGT